MIATLILWVNLSPDSFRYGLMWLIAGIVVMLVLTRFWTKPLRIKMEEDDMPSITQVVEEQRG